MYMQHQGENPGNTEHTSTKTYTHQGYHKNGGGQIYVDQHV